DGGGKCLRSGGAPAKETRAVDSARPLLILHEPRGVYREGEDLVRADSDAESAPRAGIVDLQERIGYSNRMGRTYGKTFVTLCSAKADL
ncbi:MAG: hypothetical protein L7F78_08350, partial [Syntrophales bacterium LBB04]|nr:hypothetical protein [Syntrophales bacterium LBB04]